MHHGKRKIIAIIGMEHTKRNKILLIICALISLMGISCSHKAKSSEVKNNKPQYTNIDFEALREFSNGNKTILIEDKTKEKIGVLKSNSQICDWLSHMEYPPHIFICNNEFIFIRSVSIAPTGLDANFYHWLIVRQLDKSIIANIVSLSSNIKNCFSVNGKKHFVVFSYGDNYFFEEDEDKIPIEEKDYILRDSLILCKKNVFYIENK